MKLSDRIVFVREAGAIERCHTWPKSQPYRNGQHSWGVCVILRLLWPDDQHLMDFALFHDIPELMTGDVPSPAIARLGIQEPLKREDRRIMKALRLPDEHALGVEDWQKLRAADSLDLWLWAWDEEAMGNRAAGVLRDQMDASFNHKNDLGQLPPEAWDFIVEFRKEGWKRIGEVE